LGFHNSEPLTRIHLYYEREILITQPFLAADVGTNYGSSSVALN